MPQENQDKMKGTSPSKNVQQGIDRAWGQQNKGSQNPADMIKQQWNKNPVSVGGSKK